MAQLPGEAVVGVVAAAGRWRAHGCGCRLTMTLLLVRPGERLLPAASEPRANGTTDSVAEEFERAMRSIYDRARREANYSATYFLSLLAEHGVLATAGKLLRAPAVSDGFAALWERGRLDLTVEALVVQPRFAELFSEAEIEIARRRLEQFGYV